MAVITGTDGTDLLAADSGTHHLDSGSSRLLVRTPFVADLTPPTVVKFSPADNMLYVNPSVNIVLTFSEPIARGSGRIEIQDRQHVVEVFDVATSGRLSIDGNTLTLDPTLTLDWLTDYYFWFDPGSILDLAGNAYPDAVGYNFKTAPSPDTTTAPHLVTGSELGEELVGTGAVDRIDARGGNDTILASGGADTIDGGAGLDTVRYTGARSGFVVQHAQDGFTVKTNGQPDSDNVLLNVERLVFDDVKVALDIIGNAGQAYRLYQAAFDRAPDIGGLGFQMNALDIGFRLTDIAANFIESPEFSMRYGSLNNVQFVTQLYANVLHRAPDSGGLDFHVNNLQLGLPRYYLLAQFSESPENQANVIGAIQDGMVFTS